MHQSLIFLIAKKVSVHITWSEKFWWFFAHLRLWEWVSFNYSNAQHSRCWFMEWDHALLSKICINFRIFTLKKTFFSGQLMIFQISRMHTKRKQTIDSMRINNKDFMKTIFAIHWDDGNYAHRLFLYFKLYPKAINFDSK